MTWTSACVTRDSYKAGIGDAGRALPAYLTNISNRVMDSHRD